MKVDKGVVNELLVRNTKQSRAEGLGETEEKKKINGRTVDGSKVLSISKEAELLDHLKKLKDELDELDMNRVEFYRNLVGKGEYRVDRNALAERLVQVIEGGDL